MGTLSSLTSAVEQVSSGHVRAGALHAKTDPHYLKACFFSMDVRSILHPSFPGTIGLSLAHQVSKIIGIEMVEKAVEDARWNAAFNGEFKFAVAEGFKLTAEKTEAEVSRGILTAYLHATKGGTSCYT